MGGQNKTLGGIARDTGVRRGSTRTTRARGSIGDPKNTTLGQSRGNASKVFESLAAMGFLSPDVDRAKAEHVIGLVIGT